ncbi:SigE family RNA polymerase sigma factor [Kribbella solani]|uniref:SigE family RNA polymerase sigma factor n=1 Tax=Kribbella solani TaxID=236067 RepID=UPI0029AE9E1D|nr:SigE family RNA polymerase sigma factor [Kribbella solani]MDX2971173.1 SigE family RNA polymerase sigma factor [Kribbella solani]MDX3006256.1 SigE family RNA polymerase sigma factor [Kribbella solani]
MRGHEEEAFRLFMSDRMPHLLRAAYLLCGDHHLAEDIVGTAVVRLYRSWRRVVRAEHPAAYARQVVVRTWIDGQRRSWRQEQPTADLPELPVDDRAAEVALQRADLRRLLDRLPVRQRAVLVLRFYEDLSVDDTAQLLQISSAAVKKLTQRALSNVRSHLPAGGTASVDIEEAR